MVGDKQAPAIWAYGQPGNHWIEGRHFRFRAISDSQTCFVAQRDLLFGLAPMATLLREDMDIVIFAAANIKIRAIRRPRQPYIGVGNAQSLLLNRLCLLNIENENI